MPPTGGSRHRPGPGRPRRPRVTPAGTSDEERYEIGLNRSAVHTDVVIGGDGMTVTGTGPKGPVDIIRDDEWVLGT